MRLSPIVPLEPSDLREPESLLVLSCGDATVEHAVLLWLTDHHPIRGVLIHDVDVVCGEISCAIHCRIRAVSSSALGITRCRISRPRRASRQFHRPSATVRVSWDPLQVSTIRRL